MCFMAFSHPFQDRQRLGVFARWIVLAAQEAPVAALPDGQRVRLGAFHVVQPDLQFGVLQRQPPAERAGVLLAVRADEEPPLPLLLP